MNIFAIVTKECLISVVWDNDDIYCSTLIKHFGFIIPIFFTHLKIQVVPQANVSSTCQDASNNLKFKDCFNADYKEIIINKIVVYFFSF